MSQLFTPPGAARAFMERNKLQADTAQLTDEHEKAIKIIQAQNAELHAAADYAEKTNRELRIVHGKYATLLADKARAVMVDDWSGAVVIPVCVALIMIGTWMVSA